MPSIMTLTGSKTSGRRTALGADDRSGCRCVRNSRTGRGALLCPVPKSKKHRSGWAFKGKCS